MIADTLIDETSLSDFRRTPTDVRPTPGKARRGTRCCKHCAFARSGRVLASALTCNKKLLVSNAECGAICDGLQADLPEASAGRVIHSLS